jgi:hypothetical protein
LPETEGGKAHYLPEHERARAEDDCLRGQHGSPLRDGGERGSDHAAAVLGADHENAQRAYRDLGQVYAAEAGQSGVEIAEFPRPSSLLSCAQRAQTTAPSPTMSNAARIVVQFVDRTDRSLVHSESSRLLKPIVVAGDCLAGGEMTALVMAHPPRLGSQRCHR